MSKRRQHSDDIYVGAHYRVRGERRPKWILINCHERPAVCVDLRRWSFARDLGVAKVYFKNQLKRALKERGLHDDPEYIMLAVR